MKLVIVESPTKVKTISKYLGEEYKVMASYGHIRDLASKGFHNLGVDIESHFTPTYELTSKGFTVSRLKAAAREADEVMLATDPDREGEAISWHLAQVLELDIANTTRLEFNEITPLGIENAMKSPRHIDMDLVHSQETRRIIDRIIGYELSTLLKKKINVASAGRVQSAVLKLICDRENEINNFIAKNYWNIYACVKNDKEDYKARLVSIDGEKIENENTPFVDEASADKFIKSLDKKCIIKDIVKEEKDDFPFPPFTTSSLQQEAFNLLGFSAKKTMQIAQQLYEGVNTAKGQVGIITYMRTDSIRFSPIFIASCKKEIEAKFGAEYVGKAYSQKNDGKVQDGHEGIRPTYIDNHPEDLESYLTKDQFKLYQLIYRRAIASMMKPRHKIDTTIILKNKNAEFEIKGSETLFPGFYRAYNPKKVETLDFNFKAFVNDEIKVEEFSKEAQSTKAPYRFNEASVVRTMEKLGIGRPSTYVQTIETLKKRNYIKEERNGQIFATSDGMKTTSNLEEFFTTLVDSKYTAALETELDKIALGKQNEEALLQEFSDEFYSQLGYADENMQQEEAKTTGEVCPLCGSPLVVKHNRRTGEEFIGCSNYPTCHYIKPSETKVSLEGEGEICPKCGKGHLVTRKGKFGYFLACDSYPKCSYIQKAAKKTKKGKIFSVKKDGK